MASAPEDERLLILRKYDITGIYATYLKKLEGFKLILICDDSTSMRETLAKGQTKWDELRMACQITLDIANAYKLECDVLFLNRPGQRNVKLFSQLQEQFGAPPNGNTPLTKLLDLAISSNSAELSERKLLILIFTDGCPTSDRLSQKDAITEFRRSLEHRNPINRIFVSIVACTDDEYALKYLNNWDRKIKNLDVVDDYESEKQEIYKRGNVKQAFTYGDYVAKILLGSFVKEIDEADEPSMCSIL